jgi:hypothetical protein
MENIAVLYLNTANATNKDLTQSTATFTLNPPLILPRYSKLKVCCQSFSFTNFFINISAALGNNNFVVENDVGVVYTCVIQDGSYNVSELSAAINIELINQGLPDGLILLIPDFSTNRVVFSISQANYRISFPAGTMFDLLGCTLNQFIPAEVVPGVPVYTIAVYNELAPNVASFNSILNVYLHTSLTNNSIFSGQQSNILASIIPTASIGSVQSFEPYNMVYIDAHELSGAHLSNINIYLTDQNNNPVNLQDDWSCTLFIARMAEPIINVSGVEKRPELGHSF